MNFERGLIKKNNYPITSAPNFCFKRREEFVDAINAKEGIRPRLDRYPVGAELVWIQIVVQDKSGRSFGADSLTVVTIDEGVIKYKVDVEGEPYLRIVFQETYEEALQKLGSQKAMQAS